MRTEIILKEKTEFSKDRNGETALFQKYTEHNKF